MISWIRNIFTNRRSIENPVLDTIAPVSSTLLDKVLVEELPIKDGLSIQEAEEPRLELAIDDGAVNPAGMNPYDSTIVFDD
ncbi:MAG: hypothetical protein HKM24_05300 [Gammaproteobacteria bacterium]|nr:hypothetical protein [Gammaproteobacteria bacterium]